MIQGKANELSDYQVFRTIIKYCLFIIIIPVASFLAAKIILFENILRLEPVTGSVYAAVVGVIILHVTLGLYIYKAYGEGDQGPKPVKED